MAPHAAAGAVLTGGAVQAWGDNVSGELGVGSSTDQSTPVQVIGSSRGVTAIAAGGSESVAVTSRQHRRGSVSSWGSSFSGQLGNGSSGTAGVPTRVYAPMVGCPPGAPPSCDPVAAGGAHTLMLLPNGRVLAAGANNFGQLGDGTTIDRATPVVVEGLSDVVAVAAGGAHSLALRRDGTVWAWGDNGGGQVGDGSRGTDPVTHPVRVAGLGGVVAIAAGLVHSMALTSDGAVWTWGGNNFGQQGRGTPGQANLTAAQVPSLGPGSTTAIAAGARFSMALERDGTVMTWGQNNRGQLGGSAPVDPFAANPTPAVVPGLSGAVAIAAGAEHALALEGDGTVMAWGLNRFGELGNPSAGPIQNSPVAVEGIRDARAIAAGGAHSLAITGSPGLRAAPGAPLPPDPPVLQHAPPAGAQAAAPPTNVLVTPADPLPFSRPRVAADPTHPGHLAAAYDAIALDFSTSQCWLSLSSDGGATWTARPLFGGPTDPSGSFCLRPAVAYQPDGTLIYAAQNDTSVILAASSDEGATFTAPLIVDTAPPPNINGDFFGGDIGIDPVNGDVYVPWARFLHPALFSPLLVARCTAVDITSLLGGGQPACATHDATSQQVNAGNVRVRIAVGADHRVYLAWGDETEAAAAGVFNPVAPINIELVTSSDQGRDWSLPTIADRLELVCPQGECTSGRTLPTTPYNMSNLAVGGRSSHDVFVAAGGPHFGDNDHANRIVLSRFATGPSRWQRRTEVGVISGSDSQQHDPEVSAPPDGGVNVAYYDLTSDLSFDNVYLIHSSSKEGMAFTAPLQVNDTPIDESVISAVFGDPRIGLVNLAQSTGVAWVDTRRGTPGGKSDIGFAAAPVP